MKRFGTHIWRHGLAIAGVKRSQPSALKTVLLTLPWLVLSAVASNSESFPGAAAQTPTALGAAHERVVNVLGDAVAIGGAKCMTSGYLTLVRIARQGD